MFWDCCAKILLLDEEKQCQKPKFYPFHLVVLRLPLLALFSPMILDGTVASLTGASAAPGGLGG